MDLEHIEFNLYNIVDDVLSLLGEKADHKGLELVGHVSTPVPSMVRGDPSRIRQVLTNLVQNAIKFTEEGEVALRVTIVED